jgi:O-antigen ligase
MLTSYTPNKAKHKANNVLMWSVVSIIAVAPFLLGSNRPLPWTIWAVLLSVIGTVYFAYFWAVDAQLRGPPRAFGILPVLFTVFVSFLIVQIIPMGFISSIPTSASLWSVAPMSTISWAPGQTALALLRWLTFGLLFFLSFQFSTNQNRSRLFLHAIFAVIVLHACFGLTLRYQFGDTLFFMPKWAYQGSATGGFVNRNSFATFLAFGLVLGAGLASARLIELSNAGRDKASKMPLAFIAAGLIAILITLFATNSRMGLFAAISGAASIALIATIKHGSRRAAFSLVFAIMILFSAALYLYGENLVDRTLSVERDANLRFALYRQIWEMIGARYLLGYGGGGFELSFPMFRSATFLGDQTWDKTHSSYLALWADYGVIFGSLPMLMIVWCGFKCLQKIFLSPNSNVACMVCLGSIITAAVHSSVDFSLEIEAVTFVFVAILGAGAAGAFARNDAPKSSPERSLKRTTAGR